VVIDHCFDGANLAGNLAHAQLQRPLFLRTVVVMVGTMSHKQM
jgi:hypothetical protein